jgi:DNA polymerase-3 subunit gamma/tau
VAIPGSSATAVLDRPRPDVDIRTEHAAETDAAPASVQPPSTAAAVQPPSTANAVEPASAATRGPDADEVQRDAEAAGDAATSNPNRRVPTERPAMTVGFRERPRYGEAVVRELLGAKFVEEQQITPPSGGQSGWSG